jgi:hypothetical protein
MKPEPIYIRPGTFSLAGSPVEKHMQDLDIHIARLHGLLGDELKTALAGMGDSLQNESLALISFTGAFTGMSTLLTFCSFIRGVIALEKGMETQADKNLVATLRKLLVPIVTSQCEILKASMATQLAAEAASLLQWYEEAHEAVQAIHGFIGRLG